MADIITKTKNKTLQIRQHGSEAGRIVLLCDGEYVCDFVWQAADQIATVLRHAARVAENNTAAAKQVMDQAILLRAGVPVGLSSNPKVYDEALKEAVHNRDLRKSNLVLAKELPIRRDQFGIPQVRNGRSDQR